ncbi:hypothetical protein QGN29_04365 [Temperatibacter marinus]|uniref:D-alanine--D-alanine ligase n=1 Tax=Temperatibacter marinus TaxID=1456591 RepID=A0AA52H9W1_9PROT|nr:hypothetical protein [Temperatibacter marinus]WND03606.1 hypothetical protein QGN29_04365 [Temperatibacter marinus]
MTATNKKNIAVFFGGRSVEHDVSVLTALQFIEALSPLKYSPLPVYVDPLGQFWGGEALLDRSNYPIDAEKMALSQLHLDISASQGGNPLLYTERKKLFGSERIEYPFDLAVPAIHGSNGEDGTLQGLFDFAAIPYAGCRPLAASSTMDKGFTKHILRTVSVPCLPDLILKRPKKGTYLEDDHLAALLKEALGSTPYPLIVKPCNLGSSVGVAKAEDPDDCMAAILSAFRMDHAVIIEPFVQNLTEYNIAVRRLADGSLETSAIEEPKRGSDLLDFQEKYMQGSKSGKKLGHKTGGSASEGMVSLGRTLNPDHLSKVQINQLQENAKTAFDRLDLAGSVRIDFLSNRETGEIWLNEINTIPGSFAYFLWEAASPSFSFLELTDAIIQEGFQLTKERSASTSSALGNASIFGA